MSIHLYAACWNEERIIPFFLQHYEPLVDRIIIYDDHSTDRSVELLRASPKVEIRPFQREAESYSTRTLPFSKPAGRKAGDAPIGFVSSIWMNFFSTPTGTNISPRKKTPASRSFRRSASRW